jgi:hypothetical protein
MTTSRSALALGPLLISSFALIGCVADPAPELATESAAIEWDTCICQNISIPVCGVDGQTYTNSCFASCAKVDIAYHAACNGQTVPAELKTMDVSKCTEVGGVFALPAEDGHRYAARLVTGDTPFMVETITYGLFDPLGVEGCTSTPTHQVEVYAESDDFPDATPTVLFSEVVSLGAPPAMSRLRTHTITLAQPIVVDSRYSLYVSIEMINNDDDGRTCVHACEAELPPAPGSSFWSNAASPPYTWADMLDYNITKLPIITVGGQEFVPEEPCEPHWMPGCWD